MNATPPALRHQRPPRSPCAHRKYAMDCEEYDIFVKEHGARCAICDRTGPETKHGFLVIDHDPHVGYWAVRGLLCSTCNSRITDGRPVTEDDAVYLADPWWRRRYAALGIAVGVPPEPGIGAVVKCGRLRYTRTKTAWECASLWHNSGKKNTWRGLYYTYGPKKLIIVAGQLALV